MRKITPQRVGLALTLCLGLLPMSGIADYLSELDAEAEASAEAPGEATGGQALGEDRAQAQERKAFERTLKAGYPHVYTFYGRLSEANKRKVLDGHLREQLKQTRINKMILDLYFAQSQK